MKFKEYFFERWLIIVLILIVVQSLLVLYSPSVPRGSDQFWYVVDAENVAKGIYTTNNVFPNSLPSENAELRPFVQNRPIVYIAGFLIWLGLNSVKSYQLINLIALLSIVYIMYNSLRLLKADKSYILSALVFFIASPLVIHSVYNTLTNMFDSMLFAIFLSTCYIIFYSKFGLWKKVLSYFCMAISLLCLAYQRSDFIFHTYFILIGISIHGIIHRYFTKVFGFSILIATFSIQFLLNMLSPFHNHLGGSVPENSIFLTGINAELGNMVSFLGKRNDFVELTLTDILVKKVYIFIKSALTPLNLISISYLLLLLIPFLKNGLNLNRWRIFEIQSVFFFSSTVLLLIYFQFQYRYVVFLIGPALLILHDFLKIFDIKSKIFGILWINISIFIFSNVFINVSIREDTKKNKEMQKVVTSLKIANFSEVAVIYGGGSTLIWSWLLPNVDRLHFLRKDSVTATSMEKWNILVTLSECSIEENNSKPYHSHHVLGDYIVYIRRN